ncbi:MAG: UPF0182 family protein [Syntrophales bacterium]
MSIIQRPGRLKGNLGIIIFIGIILFLMLFWRIAGFITDWFWFQEVGYQTVFVVTYMTQLKTAALFGLVFFAVFYGNLFLAFRFSSRPLLVYDREGTVQIPAWELKNRTIQMLIVVVSLLFSLFAALQGASRWEDFLKFSRGGRFGIIDPVFNQDIGFYVFQFPFLKSVYGWLMVVLILTAGATAFLYFIRRSFLFVPPKTWRVASPARMHLSVLAACIFFLATYGAWLDLYGILFTKRGVVYGPGYTEITTQLWILKLQMVLSILVGAAFLAMLFRRGWRIPAIAVLVFLAVLVVGRSLYPAFVQKFKVIPNEIVLERPYLERNIHYTRLAYRLNDIEDREFPTSENLTSTDLKRNDLTVKNIRLWNHAPLLSTYGQLQEIRTYYKFGDVDNDRYQINGEYRQVMLSPREISYQALPSRTWVNEHLIYTHGYGAVMSPVNRISREGLPEFFIKDIPPVSFANIRITRPEIYYGENSNEYVFVKTKRPEFDYPVGEKNMYSRYEGKGGVPLTYLRKLLFAARFKSVTVLLSDDITSESRVMYYRKIKDRVSRIAPFVRLDRDPYLVITGQGRLVWILDGYTVTDWFPYSEPIKGMGNYVRNSLKAVVDAYDGTVDLYISDPADPIMRTYAGIFPGIFKNLEDMPEDLQKHIRYPHDIFSIQARMYRAYHMQDPQVFYNKEDLWAIPGKQVQGSEQEIEPYYTILRFPGETKEEFILLIPFTPSNKDNMSAWMGARCDAPNYGKVIVYNFPKQTLVYGPRQIEARIDQDTEISKQLSLWNQRGSQVIRGSLLAIPIEKSIIYVESLYLAAEKGQLPELKRVILAFGNSISMEENLELAIQRIFGGDLIKEKEIRKPAGSPVSEKGKSDRQTAIEALNHYRKAQEYLRQGNWAAYGDELRKMDELLRSIEKQ